MPPPLIRRTKTRNAISGRLDSDENLCLQQRQTDCTGLSSNSFLHFFFSCSLLQHEIESPGAPSLLQARATESDVLKLAQPVI